MVKYHGVAVEATPRSLLPSFLPLSLSLPLFHPEQKKKRKTGNSPNEIRLRRLSSFLSYATAIGGSRERVYLTLVRDFVAICRQNACISFFLSKKKFRRGWFLGELIKIYNVKYTRGERLGYERRLQPRLFLETNYMYLNDFKFVQVLFL